MMREQFANNLEQVTDSTMTKWEARVAFTGITMAMANRALINPQVIKSFEEASRVLGIADENSGGEPPEPPRPPRRPNAPIRGIALGNT